MEEKQSGLETLTVFKYMNEEKLHPTACNQVACTGSGDADLDRIMAEAKAEIKEMGPAVLKKMLDNGEDVTLLDVRELSDKSNTQIATDDESYAMTRGNIELRIKKVIDNKDAVIVVYCSLGARSLFAAQTMKHLGYKNVYSLQAGLKGWARAGYPFVEDDEIVIKKESEI